MAIIFDLHGNLKDFHPNVLYQMLKCTIYRANGLF